MPVKSGLRDKRYQSTKVFEERKGRQPFAQLIIRRVFTVS
jgi:hypothetical protein